MLFGLPPGSGERIGSRFMERSGVDPGHADALAENPEYLAVAAAAVWAGVTLAFAAKAAGEYLGPILGEAIVEELA